MNRIKSQQPIVFIPKKGFKDLEVRSFEARLHGKIAQGLVVKKGGRYFAYRNLCKHLPVTLDLEDDGFFTHDKASLQCHMHGAVYEIETGLCTEGPCQGARLDECEVVEEETRLVIRVPDKFFEKE